LFQVTGLGARINVVALGAYQLNSAKTNAYAGTGLSYDVFTGGGWKVTVLGGFKGLDFTNLGNTTFSWKSLVFGVGVNIPVK
jgi:hypothetical protein